MKDEDLIKRELLNSLICDDVEALKEHCPNTYKWLKDELI